MRNTNSPRVEIDVVESRRNAMRISWGIIGLASVIIGIILLVNPGVPGMIVTIALAIYALVAGIVAVTMAFMSKQLQAWGRISYGAIGIACLVAGIVALANFGDFKEIVTWLLAITLGLVWLVDGGLSLYGYFSRSDTVWSLVFGIIAITAGVVLLIQPLWGYTFVVIYLGVALVILGLIRFYRAFVQPRDK